MAFVQQAGQISSLQRPSSNSLTSGIRYRTNYFATYEEIYRTQPAVRTVVGFMARNIAQIGIHLFNRVSDADRERVTDHPMINLINNPLPPQFKITRYKMMDSLVNDLGIYDEAMLLKIKAEGSNSPGGLLRIPPPMFEPGGDNWFAPEFFVIKGNRGKREVGADEVVYLRGYNPDDSRKGLSPMETLRSTLAEEWESRLYRAQMWENGARASGYIQRPTNAPRWRDGSRERFMQQFSDEATGQSDKPGGAFLLEDGMTFVNASITPEEAQYIEGRKFTREEVAAAYYIPPPMVGILDNASFNNITEQHKMLYQDALGPWLESLAQDFMLQLLTDFEPVGSTFYVEFNINEKQRGSFEEQAASISTLTGRPILTANEGRALLNRNALPEGEGLVMPLNVLIGGQAAPTQPTADPGSPLAAIESTPTALAGGREVSAKARISESATDSLAKDLAAFFERQGASIVSKVGAKAKAGTLTKDAADSLFDETRWNNELTGLLFPSVSSMATKAAKSTLEDIGSNPDDYDEERASNWLFAHAAGVASGINGATKHLLRTALGADSPLDAVRHLFEMSRDSRSRLNAETEATASASFGTHEAIHQSGKDARKTWVTTSSKPRKSHARMNGETVALDETFSNGGRWPGDSKLKGEERARCSCDLRIKVEG